MIALPVAAHSISSKDSPVMSDAHWPSLSGSGGGEPPAGPGDGDDWEMLSPTASGDDIATNGEEVVMVPMPNPHPLLRCSSVSAPDLRELDGTADEDQDISILNHEDAQTDAMSSSVVMVSNPPSIAGSSSVVVVSNPWAKKGVSFRDAILSPSKHASAAPSAAQIAHKPRVKNKVKPRYVVTPIKRCAKSTGDLLSLVVDDEEEEEALGASDAMEYYNRKSHGAHGRSNGLKQRPDEAKRKEMIVHKKNMQRQNQR